MITAIFNPDTTMANAYGLWQYDYGQILRIQGLHLPSMVEIHFSMQETGGIAPMRVGVTKDGVTDVVIPDSMLENDGATSDYDIFAFVYLTDATSGQTEYKIKLRVKSRPEPEVPGGGEDPDIFHEAVQAVRKSADKAAESEKQAEGWAHGREDLPERAQDNAKYYSDQTAADAKKTGTDRKEVERLVESVSGIDEQVVKVENLTKQAQTSATNAALSEQAAKTAETNAQTAQAGAETAEGNAELAERNAKVSEQAVEKAKQLVTQMGQDVLDNKNHVDQTTQAFTLTAQQAVADVNNAGQAQTERAQSVGNTAVESVNETVRPMVNAGDTPLPWEPFKSRPELQISTPDGIPGIPVLSDENYTDSNGQKWVCDTLDLAQGIRLNRLKKASLANRPWAKSSNNRFYTQLHDASKNIGHCLVLCSCYQGTDAGHQLSDNNQISLYRDGGNTYPKENWLYIRDDTVSTPEEMQQKMNQLNAEIIYITADPTKTTLPQGVMEAYGKLHSNDPATTIMTDAGAGMKVKYIVDTKKYIDQKIAKKIETVNRAVVTTQKALI